MGKSLQKSFTLFYVAGLVIVNVCYFTLKSSKDKHVADHNASACDSIPTELKEQIAQQQISLK